MICHCAKICVSNINFLVDKEFTYKIPPEMKDKITIGSKVIVPFGRANRKKEGIVTQISEEECTMPLKSVSEILKEDFFAKEENIDLARYMSEKYYAPLYECVNLMLMPGSSVRFVEIVRLNQENYDENEITDELSKKIYTFLKSENKEISYFELEKNFDDRHFKKAFSFLSDLGIVEKVQKSLTHTTRTISVVRIIADDEKLNDFLNLYSKKAKAQCRIIEVLSDMGEIPLTDLIAFSGASRMSVKALEEREIVEVVYKEVRNDVFKDEKFLNFKKPVLNDEQKNAVDTVLQKRKENDFCEFLIKGVTGSGKTEIYLELCENIINEGKTAIILVPEISLTPQIRQRFFNRFGSLVAVLHSALSVSERKEEWKKIKNGEVKIAVGARSAVFAPFENLSMIIIDEEHETTYKSENSPRYDAKDIARYLMKRNKGTLILASATPCVVTYYRAMQGEIGFITVTKRYNETPLPYVSTVDMKEELKSGNHGVLSNELTSKLEEARDNKKKSILLLNRRGYSTFVSCRDCGYVIKCPKCDVAMTYHSTEASLKCHYCGNVAPTPTKCPECGRNSIRYFGTGTQKLEEELYRIFPESKIIRMDNDTTNTKMSHERLLKRFKNEPSSILVGTQMIAKGLDFKDVSLVGVVAADSTLFVGGYIGNEKTFSLITQVCGRAGRGTEQGYAVVQTYQPDHYAIVAAKTQDYEKFYENEINFRKNVKYPPFCDIINIIFTGSDEKKLFSHAESIKKHMTKAVDEHDERKHYISMYGPVPCSVAKIKDKYRFHILIKCTKAQNIKTSLFEALKNLMKTASSDITVSVDVNPVNFI